MPMPDKFPPNDETETAQKTLIHYARAWGASPLPPTLTATLLTALHLRPPQLLPLLFPPIFLFSSYLNVNDYTKDSAGLTAAWSAAYLLISRRGRKNHLHPGGLRGRFGARGLVRGSATVLCLANVVGAGLVWSERGGFWGDEEDGDGGV